MWLKFMVYIRDYILNIMDIKSLFNNIIIILNSLNTFKT